ncbi:hypothetical protein OUZ56_022264 [Daphnia magna]|uniref:Uncharacterized protein n=1 Tax=Daphnia magna TaxID=35525 RepID=A0ABR0AVV0_9CRUS|nr:hypothetical protein OUZ56_022264 [Daphnia magna]
MLRNITPNKEGWALFATEAAAGPFLTDDLTFLHQQSHTVFFFNIHATMDVPECKAYCVILLCTLSLSRLILLTWTALDYSILTFSLSFENKVLSRVTALARSLILLFTVSSPFRCWEKNVTGIDTSKRGGGGQ